MPDNSKYIYRFMTIAVLIGFCAAGSVSGFLRLAWSLFGCYEVVTFWFITILFASLCVGLMSPQWLIRILSRMTGRARAWLSGADPASKPPIPWLPGGPADAASVNIVLAGCIVPWAFFAIGATLSDSLLERMQIWFESSFFLSLTALRILDIFLLLLLLFPTWFIAGVILAVLYRLALSYDIQLSQNTIRESPSSRQTNRLGLDLPMLLLLGLAIGSFFWWTILSSYVRAQSIIWLSHLPAVAGALYLIARAAASARSTPSPAHETTSAMLERTSADGFSIALTVIFCGVLIGGTMPLWFYLFSLVNQSSFPGASYNSIFLLSLAAGSFFSARKINRFSIRRLALSVALLLFSALGLIATIVLAILWRNTYPARNTFRDVMFAVLILLLTIKIATLGVTLTYGKQLVQEIAISRSRGWAYWLLLTILGIVVGWFLTLFVFIPHYGSLMALSIWVLASLMVGGLTVIYKVPHARPYRSSLIITGFLLVALNSFVMPWAARTWLRLPSLSHIQLAESGDAAWALIPGPFDNGVLTVDLSHPGTGGDAVKFSRAYDNGFLARTVLAQAANETMLFAGFNENIWPPPPLSPGVRVDMILNPQLAKHLRQLNLLGENNRSHPEHSLWPVTIIDRSLTDWLRHTDAQYDFILINLPETKYVHGDASDIRFWRRLRRRLRPGGVIMIQFQRLPHATRFHKRLIKSLIEIFGPYGGQFRPSKPPVESHFIILFDGREAWENFHIAHGRPPDATLPGKVPITVRGLLGTLSPLNAPLQP